MFFIFYFFYLWRPVYKNIRNSVNAHFLYILFYILLLAN